MATVTRGERESWEGKRERAGEGMVRRDGEREDAERERRECE